MKCSFVICRCSYRVQCGPAWQETCDYCGRSLVLMLVLLLHLLLLWFTGVLVRELLVFLVLLLLELVSFHLLIRPLLVLLLLILLVQLRLAGIWSGRSVGRKIARVHGSDGLSGVALRTHLIRCAIARSIRRSCLPGWYCAAVVEISRPGRCGDTGLAHIRRGALLWIGSGRLRVLSLCRYRWNVSLPPRRIVLHTGARDNSAIATVIADAVHRGVRNRP